MAFPPLYGQTKSGKWKSWKVSVEGDRVIILHGQVDGKQVREERVMSTLKRNYKDLHEQAMAFAGSKWRHKREREAYQENMATTISNTIMPMLAKTFDNNKSRRLRFPLYVQPKIDGLRCIAHWSEQDGQVHLFSRTGKEFTSPVFSPIRQELCSFLQKHPHCSTDGEIYSRDIPFEELSGHCRRVDSHDNVHLTYHVFDMVVDDVGFTERLDYFPTPSNHVECIETLLVDNMEQVEQHLDRFIADGYEGIILRNAEGKYEKGHRSWDLQKWKRFMEEEFEIVGFHEGEGRETGTVIWECTTDAGKRFRARPIGNMVSKRNMLKDASSFLGKKLTIVFQEWTKDGVPRFPVAKAIRHEHD